MKKFEEILKDITMVRNEIKVLKEKQEVLTNQYLSVGDIKKRVETKKDLLPELDNISDQIVKKELTIKILKNNAKLSLFNEVVPIIKEVLEQFNNKPYGEKTRDKIAKLIQDKTSCRAYIYSDYGNGKITVYRDNYYNDYNLDIGSSGSIGDHMPLLENNKIQADNFKNVKLYHVNDLYVENIPAHIGMLKDKYEQAYKLQEELNAVCKEFNKLAVGNIEYIHVDNKIYKTFRG